MALISGPLDLAGLEALASDPVTFNFTGRVYFNTGDNSVRVYNGSAYLEVADLTSVQTFTAKVIDADNNTISNLAHGAEVDNPTSGVHGVTGSVVGTTDTQTLTGKTINGDNNTITNLAHGAEVDNLTSGVHGVTGNVVGTTDTQTLSAKTLTSPVINSPASNGGTASDTVYSQLAAAALATLSALSRLAGGLYYDSTNKRMVFSTDADLLALVSQKVTGTRAAPTAITAAGGITSTAGVGLEYQFVESDGGAVNITADPQISAGTVVGQRLILQGRSNTDTLLIEVATGVSLNGDCILDEDTVLSLIWDGTNWTEISRSK